jgi:hypothetical protein
VERCCNRALPFQRGHQDMDLVHHIQIQSETGLNRPGFFGGS